MGRVVKIIFFKNLYQLYQFFGAYILFLGAIDVPSSWAFWLSGGNGNTRLLLFNQSIATYHQLSHLIELTGGGPLPQAPVMRL